MKLRRPHRFQLEMPPAEFYRSGEGMPTERCVILPQDRGMSARLERIKGEMIGDEGDGVLTRHRPARPAARHTGAELGRSKRGDKESGVEERRPPVRGGQGPVPAAWGAAGPPFTLQAPALAPRRVRQKGPDFA